MKGRRPAWLIRFGLFLYDNLGGRKILPGTKTLKLHSCDEGKPLVSKFEKAFEYSDCWVEDSRLVVLNARDAYAKGATIHVQSKVISATFTTGLWHIVTRNSDGYERTTTAKMIINAGGPWVEDIIRNTVRLNSTEGVRLVRGSHIVTKKLYEHDKCYFFQGEDGRIVFSIPYEDDFTLIGTTDADHESPSIKPVCTPEETLYLIDFANKYFINQISKDDVVWTYSGSHVAYENYEGNESYEGNEGNESHEGNEGHESHEGHECHEGHESHERHEVSDEGRRCHDCFWCIQRRRRESRPEGEGREGCL
jgi:glycerol-3-phosphate dehydrogenase